MIQHVFSNVPSQVVVLILARCFLVRPPVSVLFVFVYYVSFLEIARVWMGRHWLDNFNNINVIV